jgi:hypothetical protein
MQLTTFPMHLKLMGLNSLQISDFNSALLKFGVINGDFSALYTRVQTYLQMPHPKELLSLMCCAKTEFISYAQFITSFHN